MNSAKYLIDRLKNKDTKIDDMIKLLNLNGAEQNLLFNVSHDICNCFKRGVYIRGVIEISNICNNSCKYCSMSRTNSKLERYYIRLDRIKQIVKSASEQGIRVFHIASGENDKYTDEGLIELIDYIYSLNCKAILVLGRKSNSFLDKASLNREITYISKFETSNPWLYNEYNDKNGSLDMRLEFLNTLIKKGFLIGTGNIVGLPFQTDLDLVNDLIVIKKLKPKQASTSRFISSKYSEYSNFYSGNIVKTLNFLAILRLILGSEAIIPTNSSLGDYKWEALKFGANLISINLTLEKYYKNYIIYNEKLRLKQSIDEVEKKLQDLGYRAIYEF